MDFRTTQIVGKMGDGEKSFMRYPVKQDHRKGIVKYCMISLPYQGKEQDGRYFKQDRGSSLEEKKLRLKVPVIVYPRLGQLGRETLYIGSSSARR
jgi:hypothetical protein